MTAVVHFLDDTFDDLQYDMTTTVIEAVEQLAGMIKLQNYSTFTLFDARKVGYTFVSFSCYFVAHAPHLYVLPPSVWET